MGPERSGERHQCSQGAAHKGKDQAAADRHGERAASSVPCLLPFATNLPAAGQLLFIPIFVLCGACTSVRLCAAGESEAGLRGIWAAARELAPSLVFIDEVDALAPARGGGAGGAGVAAPWLSVT